MTDEAMVKQNGFVAEAVPHHDALHRYALRLTANSDDAHDLVQETYLKALRFWDSYEHGTNVRAWLFLIMKNSFINQYRKGTREATGVDFQKIENFYDTIRHESSEPNNLQDKIFGESLSDEVEKALASLPDDHRTVVILCDIEGLTYGEAAKFMNCPIGTIRSRLHRGRRQLREKLSAALGKRNGGAKSTGTKVLNIASDKKTDTDQAGVG